MSTQSHPTMPQNQKRQKCEIYSRVSGYLRPVNSWNKGKQSEFYDRKEYKIDANTT